MSKNKQHYSKVAELGCILCKKLGYEGTACEIHHIRRAGVRSDSPVIGLCPMHHRWSYGIHNMGRKRWERYHETTEEELLAWTEELLNGTNN
jgi:hypothetical protein